MLTISNGSIRPMNHGQQDLIGLWPGRKRAPFSGKCMLIECFLLGPR